MSVEEAKRALEEERRKFEEEKRAFEASQQEASPDSGIGSRNDSAEVFDADAEESEAGKITEDEEEEFVPPRRNR